MLIVRWFCLNALTAQGDDALAASGRAGRASPWLGDHSALKYPSFLPSYRDERQPG